MFSERVNGKCQMQSAKHLSIVGVVLVGLVTTTLHSAQAAEFFEARDLNLVKMLMTPGHESVSIVRDGKATAVVYVAARKPTGNLKKMVSELVEVVRLSTGAELDVVEQMPSDEQPAIVIGDCEASRGAGIDAAQIPLEGFVVKTAPGRVYLVGSSREYPIRQLPILEEGPRRDPIDSTTWALVDFLERFAGVRWYWPTEADGRSIIKADSLVVPPAHYRDAPVFQYRHPYPSWFKTPQSQPGMPQVDTLHPPLLQLRAGGSWPWTMRGVHSLPVNAERTLGSPQLFDYMIKGCEEVWDRNNPAGLPGTRFVRGDGRYGAQPDAVYVSYLDHRVKIEHVSEAWRQHMRDGGPVWSRASLVMGMFVRQLAEEVQKRWPDKRVVYLPYWDYCICPDIDFPDNLEVQLCITHTDGMPGMTEPWKRSINDKNIRAWHEKAGGRITLWNYLQAARTNGPVQFPFLIQEFHRTHRDRLAGSFINGIQNIKEWSTLAPSMYVYMKVLWNPDVNVEAILDELCRRQFGEASETTRKLLQLMVDRWEKTRWSVKLSQSAGLSADGKIFSETWPPDVVERMSGLRKEARARLQDDRPGLRRLDYWLFSFDDFLKEAEGAWEMAGILPRKEILRFWFEGLEKTAVGHIDHHVVDGAPPWPGKPTISVTVPKGTDVTALQPTVTHTGLSIRPQSGAVQDFSRPVVYTVIDKYGYEVKYKVTITVAP